MSAMNYEILDPSFDWRTINYANVGLTIYDATYENKVLVIQCDFAPATDPTTNPEYIPATGFIFPPGVTLLFEGGSFTGVTLQGNNTKIEAPLDKIFDVSVTLTGTFLYKTFYPEWYGAVGDGVTTDYKALSATCKNATHVTLTQTYHYYDVIEDSIIVNDKETFTLIGYGSLLVNSDPGLKKVQATLFTFQNIKNLVIKGVSINGNYKMAKGIKINDIPNVTLRDVNITKLRNTESDDNALGIDIRVLNGSIIHGDNVRISEIDGGFDNAIDDGDITTAGIGVARALYIRLDYASSGIIGDTENKEAQKKTKITFDNSFFEWVYGDDGDVIDIIDEKYISDALHRFIFTNCTIRYAFRRLVKGSASGIQYYNCKFDTASLDELKEKMQIGPEVVFNDLVKPSGGVNFRNANPSSTIGSTFRNMHGKMINCEYRNTGNLDFGNGDTLIAAYTDGLEIRGCHFYNMYIRFQDTASNFRISNNIFQNSNLYLNVSAINWRDNERSYVEGNYGHYSPAESIHPALVVSVNDLVRLVVDSNKVYSNEFVPVEDPVLPNINFYGILSHTGAGSATEVYVSGNEVHHDNVGGSFTRSELLISTRTWDATCRIFDNMNNIVEASLGYSTASYFFPNADNSSGVTDNKDFNGISWNNRDGNGVEIN